MENRKKRGKAWREIRESLDIGNLLPFTPLLAVAIEAPNDVLDLAMGQIQLQR